MFNLVSKIWCRASEKILNIECKFQRVGAENTKSSMLVSQPREQIGRIDEMIGGVWHCMCRYVIS